MNKTSFVQISEGFFVNISNIISIVVEERDKDIVLAITYVDKEVSYFKYSKSDKKYLGKILKGLGATKSI